MLAVDAQLPRLTFEPDAHQYFWDGLPVPNVTRIIGHLTDFSKIKPEDLERARQQGVAIHKMAELYFTDRLDLAAMYSEPGQAWLVPHYEALIRFIEESGFEPWAVERKMFHHGLRYAGTPDLFGLAPRLKDCRGPGCFDIKRSFYGGAAIGLQTIGYTKQWNDGEAKKNKDLRIPYSNRFALQLRADGTYRLKRYEDPEDEVAFLACLQQLHWKEKHYGRA